MQPEDRSIRALTATLVPLRLFNPNAKLVREITDTVVRKVEQVFVEIDRLEERLANCVDNETVDKFPHLKNILGEVRDVVEMFHLNFKTKIRHALPKIRSGCHGEDILVETLDWRRQSPCNTSFIEDWVQDKECDIDVIDSLLTNLEVYDKRKLNQVLLDRQVDYVVALVIKRYSRRDPYSKIIDDFNTKGSWKPEGKIKFFSMMDKIQDIRETSERFSRFHESNQGLGTTKFTVLEEALEDGDEAKWEIFLRLYGKGKLTAAKFLPPPKVDGIQVRHKHSASGSYLSILSMKSKNS